MSGKYARINYLLQLPPRNGIEPFQHPSIIHFRAIAPVKLDISLLSPLASAVHQIAHPVRIRAIYLSQPPITVPIEFDSSVVHNVVHVRVLAAFIGAMY